MSARRRVVFAILVLALLGAVVMLFPVTCMRRAAAPQAVVITFDVPANLDESEPPGRSFPFDALRPDRLTLYQIEHAIRVAATDDQVRGIVLHIDGINWGWAQIAEVREALRVFRHRGKPVYAALAGGGEREYLLATAAGKVCAPPTATLALDGLAISVMFFRGSLDKLGVTPNFDHVGAYKSAVEAYTRTDLSPAAREALNAVLDDHFSLLVDSLSSARSLPADSLRHLLDDGPYDAPDARIAGLVDSVMYSAEVDSMARRRGGRRLGTISLPHYVDGMNDGGLGPRIALIAAEGEILEGRSRESADGGRVLGSESLIDALRDARTRRGVRAVVLRVNSPGGSGQASDDIWREVTRCAREKPVVVSMGDYAASGGYYIAMGARDILAEPGTLTGSIGVFGGKYNIRGLLAKLGISVETLKRGRNAEMFSPFSDFSEGEAQAFQRHLASFYQIFLHRVAAARRMTEAGVDSVGQGRVWTGLAGRDRNLVDGLGGLEDAISLARRRAHIGAAENVVVETYPKSQRSFLSRMLSSLWDDQRDESLLRSLPPAAHAWIEAARTPAGTVLALMPFEIDIR